MKIVKAHNAHIPGILELLRQVCNVHAAIRPDIFRPDARKYEENDLKAILLDQNRPVFVAVEEETVLGYCFCVVRDYRGASGAATERIDVYIDDLCVEESCRGRGIATALYRQVCAWAKEMGAEFITLNVWCGNDSAMRFYERMGLTPRSITMEMPLE